MVFGRRKEDVSQDEWIQTLWANQQQLVKNGQAYWSWIQQLHKDNQAQSTFDRQVIEKLNAYDAQLGSQLELAKTVSELQKQVAALSASSHTHEGEEE